MNEKLQKRIEETKDDTKIILASVVIPFLYMIPSAIEYAHEYPINDPTYHPILFTEYIAGLVLFLFIPPLLLAFNFIPFLKKFTKIKKFIEYFTLSSWVFVFLFWWIVTNIIDIFRVHM